MKRNKKGFGIIDYILLTIFFIFILFKFLEVYDQKLHWERKRKEKERKENILKEREAESKRAAEELDNNPNLQQERIDEANRILKLMVKCPAGTFLMGSPETELGRSTSETQHKVTLSKDYYIAKYTVTQKQFKTIMGFNPSFYGGNGNPDRLKRVASECGVGDNIKFLGSLSRTMVMQELDSCDVYIQPSLQEGLPRSVIEAMSRGCPVLGANTAGIPELIAPECIFKRANPIDTAKAIQR